MPAPSRPPRPRLAHLVLCAYACLRRDGTCDSPSCGHRRRDPGGAARPVRGDAPAAERRYDLRGRSARLPRRNNRRRRRPCRGGRVLRRARCVAALPAPRCRGRSRVQGRRRPRARGGGGSPARPPGRGLGVERRGRGSCGGGSTRASPFEQALRDGGWRLALDALVPFAQIVTPSSEPRRFDTHFFLAAAPCRGRGPARRGRSPTSSCGRRSPRRSAAG